jgi:hypothetical protein
MSKQFIRVLCDVQCNWSGPAPRYRVFVNDELFAERSYNWQDSYLEELIQIDATTGEYPIRYELLAHENAQLTVTNMRVAHGNAEINDGVLRVNHEI